MVKKCKIINTRGKTTIDSLNCKIQKHPSSCISVLLVAKLRLFTILLFVQLNVGQLFFF